MASGFGFNLVDFFLLRKARFGNSLNSQTLRCCHFIECYLVILFVPDGLCRIT